MPTSLRRCCNPLGRRCNLRRWRSGCPADTRERTCVRRQDRTSCRTRKLRCNRRRLRKSCRQDTQPCNRIVRNQCQRRSCPRTDTRQRSGLLGCSRRHRRTHPRHCRQLGMSGSEGRRLGHDNRRRDSSSGRSRRCSRRNQGGTLGHEPRRRCQHIVAIAHNRYPSCSQSPASECRTRKRSWSSPGKSAP